MRVSDGTLCPLGQSNKAIGHESQIGPCIATHRVNNCQACCVSRKRLAPSRQGNGSADKKDPGHADTKQNTRSEEDHSRRASARSNSRAECRDKNGAASSRRGDFSLDIPFYRTSVVSPLIGTCGSQVGVVAGTLPKFLGHLEIRLADPPLLDFDVVRRSARVRVITNTLQGDRVPLTSKFQIRQRVRISSVPYLVQ